MSSARLGKLGTFIDCGSAITSHVAVTGSYPRINRRALVKIVTELLVRDCGQSIDEAVPLAKWFADFMPSLLLYSLAMNIPVKFGNVVAVDTHVQLPRAYKSPHDASIGVVESKVRPRARFTKIAKEFLAHNYKQFYSDDDRKRIESVAAEVVKRRGQVPMAALLTGLAAAGVKPMSPPKPGSSFKVAAPKKAHRSQSGNGSRVVQRWRKQNEK